MATQLKIQALAPWYGSNRMLADHVAEQLKGCSWVGVPFAGGMAELAKIKARTMLVSDLHRHVINLASVLGAVGAERLADHLDALPFHPDTLRYAQAVCQQMEQGGVDFGTLDGEASLTWAVNYFVCAWMARNATAGTDREFKAGIATRWNAGGGDSCVRFRNATEGLHEWEKIMRRCTFETLDVFDFLDRVQDQEGHGLYLDPPFPSKAGDKYKHKFDLPKHEQMSGRLVELNRCRIVCRFHDNDVVRRLYPEGAWTWLALEGRTQSNGAAPEVLLVRN